MQIRIDGGVYDVTVGYTVNGGGVCVSEGRTEFILFPDEDAAGKGAREYWADTAEGDSSEFICLVGEDTLVRWALGKYAGPGSTQVRSLDEWLDLWLDTPGEHWASYDGAERYVKPPTEEERARLAVLDERLAGVGPDTPIGFLSDGEQEEHEGLYALVQGYDDLVEALGFEPTVAYRYN